MGSPPTVIARRSLLLVACISALSMSTTLVAAQPAPNPYVSLLPPGTSTDWAYWRKHMQQEGARRAAMQAVVPKAMPTVEEVEPAGTTGWNDELATAEWIYDFGTDGLHAVDILGTLSPPAPHHLGTLNENEGGDNGAIPLAYDIELLPGQRIRLDAFIGDGLHGSEGNSTGDFDFYRLGYLQSGRTVSTRTTTASLPEGTRLNTKVGIYDSTGDLVEQNDDRYPGEPDSFLEYIIDKPDHYYLIVRGINSSWPIDPFDPTSGPKAGSEGSYTLTVGLDARDVDYYRFQLRKGDILNANVTNEADKLTLFGIDGVELMRADFDVSSLYPPNTPLRLGGNANIAYMITREGEYAMAAERGDGAYTLYLRAHRPTLESQITPQILFLDFDGAHYNARTILGGNPEAMLSPLSDFLGRLDLDPMQDEHAVIDHILATVTENLMEDFRQGINPNFAIDIRNSRDDADPWGDPFVSRVIVGGTGQELGLSTIGIAESIDVGNFVTNETAVVLLDRLTSPSMLGMFRDGGLGPGIQMVDLVGKTIGNVVSHEAGHLFANFHTGHPDYKVNLMDGKLSLHTFTGIGADSLFGTSDDIDVDFGESAFHTEEGLSGLLDTQNAIALGLYGRVLTRLDDPPDIQPSPLMLSAAWPNPFRLRARFTLQTARAQHVHLAVYDMLGRRVHMLHDGMVAAGTSPFLLHAGELPSGLYLLRATGLGKSASQSIMLVR